MCLSGTRPVERRQGMWEKIRALFKLWLRDLIGETLDPDPDQEPDPSDEDDGGLPDFYEPEYSHTDAPASFGGPALVIGTHDYAGGRSGQSISIQSIIWTHQLTGQSKIVHWRQLYLESPEGCFNWCLDAAHGDHAYTTKSQENVPQGFQCDGTRRGLAWCPLPQDLGGVKGPFKVEISWRATTNRGTAAIGFVIQKPGGHLVCEWQIWNQKGNGISGGNGKGFHTVTVGEGIHFVQ